MIDQAAQIQRILREAIDAARAGDNKYARPLLRRVVTLDPQHEQAWLWLSQVEETPAQRIAALEQVLQLNPENTAARRGLERLRQEQAERAPAPPITGERAPAPPTTAERAATAAPEQEQPAAVASPMEDLRPMLEASRRRKGVVRISEVVILLIGVAAIFIVGRLVLGILFPERDARPLAPQAVVPATQSSSSQAPVAPPAQQELSPQPGQLSAPTYSLQVDGAVVSESSVILNLTLANAGTAAVRYNGADFTLQDASGATLSPDTSRSSLLPGQAGVFVPIAARNQVSGTIAFKLVAPSFPLSLHWTPSDTAVSKRIDLAP